MQKNFHILPGSNIAEIKKDLWRDMGEKLKYWRHEMKKPLAIRANDTLDAIKARASTIIEKYKQVDVDILLQKWLDNQILSNQSNLPHYRSTPPLQLFHLVLPLVTCLSSSMPYSLRLPRKSLQVQHST